MDDTTRRRRWNLAIGALAGATVAVIVLGYAVVARSPEGGASTGDPTGVAAGYPVDASVLPDLVPISALQPPAADEIHVTYAPAVPPPITRSDQRIYEVRLEVLEGVCDIDPANGISTEVWGYRIEGHTEVVCGAPGPVLRGRVGDVMNITLTNLAGNINPHNIDFHAVTGQGGGARDLTVNPGETATIQVRLMYPGAFMYHCAYPEVPVHIAHGMYGMIIVDPETPLPVAEHEWAVMQSEWYVGEPDATGFAAFDRQSLFDEEARFVTFNGRTDALTGDNSLAMQVGERARIFMVNEGLNLVSNFHPIGSHWDLVYPEAATHEANRAIRGSQSTLVVAGGGTVAELEALVPETIILVDHALVRTFWKGAIGLINVAGAENPEIYGATPQTGGSATEIPEGATVVDIAAGSFNPDFAGDAYDPIALTVAVGDTVAWRNSDTVAHTVTSGASDGTSGTVDGKFDSGFLDPGEVFVYTFTEAGEFDYFCLPHPWMVGRVLVEG